MFNIAMKYWTKQKTIYKIAIGIGTGKQLKHKYEI
jgi:hypothetical protein